MALVEFLMTKTKWHKLTKEEQLEKIRKLCGWTLVKYPGIKPRYNHTRVGETGPSYPATFTPPDYLNSLDAINDALALLTPAQRQKYMMQFYGLNKACTLIKFNWLFHTASAAKRAEAFVMTVEPEHEQK